MSRALALAALVASTSFAADLAPEKAAAVIRERQKALDEVAKKYGNRRANQLSADERRARMSDEAAAVQRVLDANGVDARTLARFEATASKDERDAVNAAQRALDDEEAAAKKAADSKKPAPKAQEAQPDEHGVIIERGNGAKTKKR